MWGWAFGCRAATMSASSFRVCAMLWAVLGPGLLASGVPHSDHLKNPRFIAVRWSSRVTFSCFSSSEIRWYKEVEQGPQQMLGNSSRIQVVNNSSMSTINFSKLQPADSGTYFCRSNNITENMRMQQRCGTELKIMGISTYQQVQDRNTMKDTIILIQSILLFIFIGFPVFMVLGKENGKEVAGEEDHAYEGMAVDLANTYEDIGTYQEKAEKWDVGKHPSEE